MEKIDSSGRPEHFFTERVTDTLCVGLYDLGCRALFSDNFGYFPTNTFPWYCDNTQRALYGVSEKIDSSGRPEHFFVVRLTD
jgi:hypothetical protein